MEITEVRDILVIISTLGTISLFYIKTVSDLFVEGIKNKFKNVPGEQSLAEVISKMIVYILRVVLILIIFFTIVIGLILILKYKVNYKELIGTIMKLVESSNSPESINIENEMIVNRILNAFIIMHIIISTLVSYNYNALEKNFIKRMGISKKNSRYKKGRINIHTIKAFNIITIALTALLITSLSIMTLITIFDENLKTIKIIIPILAIISFYIAILIISIRLIEVIDLILYDNEYTLCLEEEKITCKCYLEYKEYYLIVVNNTERYIRKSSVKEILKVCKNTNNIKSNKTNCKIYDQKKNCV